MNALYKKQTFSLSLRSSISVRNSRYSVVSMNALYKKFKFALIHLCEQQPLFRGINERPV
jgi:hypothetical protein